MLKRAFELKGYRVFEASDGLEALEMAQRHQPSLIVMDLNMPVLDGLGIAGDGAHRLDEHILVDDIAKRATLVTSLLTAV